MPVECCNLKALRRDATHMCICFNNITASWCQRSENLSRPHEAHCPDGKTQRRGQVDKARERKMTLGIWTALVSHNFVTVCVDFPQCFSVFAVYTS